MITLGIETSCDETAMAILQDNTILAHEVYTQNHEAYGGVFPNVAAREHLHQLPQVMERLLKATNLSCKDLDAIGVTAGPGLVGSLLTGILYAKGLALALKKPLWPVHHLHAHALVVGQEHAITFPYLLLLLSGGHCLLAIVHSPVNYTLLGQTLDDAAGECLDKVSRGLGGPYPGGPYIESLAKEGLLLETPLPVPLNHRKDYDFSFSGLKTACLQRIHREREKGCLSIEFKEAMAGSLQVAMILRIQQTVELALQSTGLKTCVLSGGVASNAFFRSTLSKTCQQYGAILLSPSPKLCTDNGVMIAYACNAYRLLGIPPSMAFVAHGRLPLDGYAFFKT